MKSLTTYLMQIMSVALREDHARNDITTQAILKNRSSVRQKKNTAQVIAKQAGVLAGRDAFQIGFKILGAKVKCVWKINDGEIFKKGQTLLTLTGPVDKILAVERSALNLIQHLSGVASLTRQFVQAVRGTKTKILDTRKTTPGLRELEKYAVRMGGAHNHRLHLADAFLLKENHIAWAGGIENAIKFVGTRLSRPMIVEVQSLRELQTALELQVPHILLDNFSIKLLRQAVKIKNNVVANGVRPFPPKLEASGGVTLKNIRAIAKTGVDYISVGAITHSAPVVDLSLLIEDVL